MNPYRALASAVILQWMEDYQAVLRKRRLWPHIPLSDEEKITLNWLDTEWALFWCEVAEVSIDKLRKWAEEQKILNQIMPSQTVKRGNLNILFKKEGENARKTNMANQDQIYRTYFRQSACQPNFDSKIHKKQTF